MKDKSISLEIKKIDSLIVRKIMACNKDSLCQLTPVHGLNLDDYIYPGQTLLIPKKDVSYYITKDGDTLFNVSNIFGVKESDIVNNNKTIYLLPGQMIYYKK